ncbi:MAG TPA: 50S ribosomal protein L21 [Bacteriovoracaceae bacterium]|nr:50S ribosomal protein L21 [Bacteriovoracaceae bacterium]
MYTVVEIKGHQYKLSAGDLIDVERIEAEVGATITFDKVLLIGGGATTVVGAPVIGGATVTAKVVRQARTRKILILKRKPGAYRRKNGHRQCYTGLFITEINDGKGGTTKAEARAAAAPRTKAPKAEAKVAASAPAKPKAKTKAKPAAKTEGTAKPKAAAKPKAKATK